MACIRKTKSGLWRIDFRIGTARQRRSFSTKAEAEAFKRELILRPIDQVTGFHQIKDASVSWLVHEYLANVSSNKSPATQYTERPFLIRFAKRFGDFPVSQMTSKEIESYQGALRDSLGASTVNRHFNTIRHLFKKCVEWGYLAESPCRRVRNLRDDRQRTPRVLNPNEIQLILSIARPWIADVIEFILQTALRRKEVVSLRWSAIDFERRIFHVEASDGFHPKGYRPRSLPLTDQLLEVFQRKRREAAKCGRYGRDQCVFLNSALQPIHPAHLTKEFHLLKAKLNLGWFSPHCLRHTALTNMAAAGIGSAVIQKVAGHADSRTTERYVHLASHDLREGLEQLSRPLRIVN